jgi:hypothetical protein
MSSGLESITKLFAYYKSLGEKSIAQLSDEQLLWKPNDQTNSISLLVHHISGNMISRFMDFQTTDGEKPWRNREAEFEVAYQNRDEMMVAWENGWKVLFDALAPLKSEDLQKIIYIRNEGHTIEEALQRQLAHYASHIGQIILLAKIQKGDEWTTLSIPKGGTAEFNKEKFSSEKGIRHFLEGK